MTAQITDSTKNNVHTGLNIYSHFVEYEDRDVKRPSDPTRGVMYVIDTNVLLDLFKFNRDTAENLLDALEKMRDVLFVPHQVLEEFWPLVEDVRNGHHHNEARGKIQSAVDVITREVSRWRDRTGVGALDDADGVDVEDAPMPGVVIANALAELKQASETIDAVIKTAKKDAEENDWILQRLNTILNGKIGSPPTGEEKERLQGEFRQRIEQGVPPGTVDAQQKPEMKASGDFVIWKQCIDEAGRRCDDEDTPLDLTLITSDLKDDWVRRGKPHPLARRELLVEYSQATGGVFRINTFEALIDTAREHFGADVAESSLQQVQGLVRTGQDEAADAIYWSPEAVREYLSVLRSRYHDQLILLLAVHIAARDGLTPIVIPEARELVGREQMTRFTPPYRTILSWETFDRVNDGCITDPMIGLNRTPASEPWFYEFLSDPGDRLDDAIAADEDFRKLSGQTREKLNLLRSIPLEPVE